MTETYIELTDGHWYSANMDDAGKWYAAILNVHPNL